MTESMCPSLHRLGLLLQTAYRHRHDLANNADPTTIAKAELNVRRIHNLITGHRSSCRHCRFNQALKRIPPKHDSPSSNVIPINRAS